jgi:hypothetical protein
VIVLAGAAVKDQLSTPRCLLGLNILLFHVGAKHQGKLDTAFFESRIATMNSSTPIFPSSHLLRSAIQDINHSITPLALLHSVKQLFPSHRPSPLHVLLSASPLLLLTLLTFITYHILIYPLFLSPLSAIPCAHPLAAITPLWINYRRLTGREVTTTYAAFQKYGPYVRLGPAEVAVNTIAGGVTAAHGHGFNNLDKTRWYDFFINHRCVTFFAVFSFLLFTLTLYA